MSEVLLFFVLFIYFFFFRACELPVLFSAARVTEQCNRKSRCYNRITGELVPSCAHEAVNYFANGSANLNCGLSRLQSAAGLYWFTDTGERRMRSTNNRNAYVLENKWTMRINTFKKKSFSGNTFSKTTARRNFLRKIHIVVKSERMFWLFHKF